jgi:pyruvate/2-oxoglutarate dehydrogenase complex dihydrolipoamide acyltransferase (E2) component
MRRPITERLLYGVLLVKAVALALREFPDLNAVLAIRADRVKARFTLAWRSRCGRAD